VPSGQLRHKGYGKEQPIDSNETEAGRKRNQRVEVRILEAGSGKN
jgi:outer membrane protein OmpA-like peptidoglycan-associated protein